MLESFMILRICSGFHPAPKPSTLSANPSSCNAPVIQTPTAVGVWITGALHEDGLADSVDGFGAGWNPEQIRKIMKDSSIGVYGMLSLLFVMFIKFETLHSFSVEQIPLVWIAGHAVSRPADGMTGNPNQRNLLNRKRMQRFEFDEHHE